MTTLADIVNETLSEAERSLKLASARDATPVAGNPLAFLDEELVAPVAKNTSDDKDDDRKAKAKKDEKKEPEKKASAREVISDAEFATKLAEALTLGANIIAAKLASERSPLDAPGPAVQESGFQQVPRDPKAHAKLTDRISGPPTNAGPGGLPTDKADFTSTGDESGRAKNHPGKTASDWTRSKEASARLLRAKTAQAEVLMNLGQIEAAERILAEVNAKIAQDPTSPPPLMPAHNTSFKLDTEPGPSTHIGDNASLISLTKGQVRDRTMREVSQYISEPPKKDNAVAATQLRTDGQKLSHLVLPGVKEADQKRLEFPLRDLHESPRAQRVVGGILGTAVGAAVGRLLGGQHGVKGALGGAVLGGVGGVGVGHLNAYANRAIYRGLDKLTYGKEASFDPALGRAYLAKVIKTARDPDAAPADRTKAAEALKLIKSKMGVDPDALLA